MPARRTKPVADDEPPYDFKTIYTRLRARRDELNGVAKKRPRVATSFNDGTPPAKPSRAARSASENSSDTPSLTNRRRRASSGTRQSRRAIS